MKETARRRYIAAWMAVLCLFMILPPIVPHGTADELYRYYTTYYSETAAANAVTAIYLDYRVYDTLFETLLLLVSVIGIFHFSRHEGGH